MRSICHHYRDPLDQIWLETACRIGLEVERSGEVYAATDGARVLRIGIPSALDPDDCLAQMIFHEICHSLVEGPDAFDRPDWGLDNASERDVPREHACLRLQAHLAGGYGLRGFLAPTTDFRTFYDALPGDPLTPRRAPDVILAILGAQRSDQAPWSPHLLTALAASGDLVRRAAPFSAPPSLYAQAAAPAPAPHPTGLLPSPLPGSTAVCGACAWRDASGVCRQAGSAALAAWPACARFEPALDCQDCGACCREAYHSVTIERDDPAVLRHPALVVDRASYLEIRRDGDRCAALAGGRTGAEPYACTIYPDHPRPCREFEAGSDNCLTARRRVGLSL